MNRVYNAFRRHKGLALALIVVGVAAALVVNRAISPGSSEVEALQSTPTPYPERTWQINQSLTIGDFTMELIAITDTGEGLRIGQSYQTNVSELDYLPIGEPEIEYSDGSTSLADDARLTGIDEDIDVSLGSFIVADPGLTGNVDITVSSISESGAVSPQPTLSVGNRQYTITNVLFMQEEVAITVQPLNEAAKRSLLGVAAGAPVDATLTDDTGKTYEFFFVGTTFDPFNQSVDSQDIVFGGVQEDHVSSVTKFVLTIRGGGNIVGPFIFENVGIVSEDIEPDGTPTLPGDLAPGDPIPTPPNVND